MRAHTSLRFAFRLGMALGAVASISLVAPDARAGDVGAGTGGGSGAAYSSTGTAALKYEMTKGLDTSFDTGWIGPSWAQVRAVLKIDPVKNGGPLMTVDMPKGAVVDASWGTDKKIVLKTTNGAATDGTVKVRHSLTPSFDIKIDKFGINATFSLPATMLINKIPGSRFAYDSHASQQFAPWGFGDVVTTLNAPDLKDATLFSIDTDRFSGQTIAEKLDATIGVRAVTKPTFTYKTTRVVLNGADGEIADESGEATMDAVDGDYMEVMAQVYGTLDVAGAMSIAPFANITRIGGATMDTDLTIPVYSKAYTVPTEEVTFPATIVHIPMPNVHVPSEGVDLGNVKAGGSATQSVSIENSGEKEAVMTFSSSDPAFAVSGETVTVPPKGKYDLIVKFSSDTSGPALSEITVNSSDPDSPAQMFKIGANGADVGGPEGGGDDPSGAQDASGCGCKTAGGASSLPSWAGLGLAGLGAVVFARRRRNRA